MPIKHRTKFEKCANNQADRAIKIDCSQVPRANEEFKPESRSAVIIPSNNQLSKGDTQTFNPLPVKHNTLTPFLPTNSSSNPVSAVNPDDMDNQDDPDKKPYQQPMPKLRPNTKELSAIEQEKARLVRASRIAYKSNFDEAQAYIDAQGESGWKIDQELSTKEGLVLTKGEEIRVSFRGTSWENVNDVVTNAATIAGVEQHAPQIKASRQQILNVQEKYNRLPNELLGYSKGGAHAVHLGDEFEIPTTTFNALIGRQQIMSQSEVPHTIIRTVEDVPSTGLLLRPGKSNYTVKSIDPVIGNGSPKSVHDLNQFTGENVSGVKPQISEFMPKPTSLAAGALAGAAAHQLMEQVDPEHELNPVAEEGIEGGVAGLGTVGMAALAGAEVFAAPEILATSAAYMAGGESSKAITGAMKKNDNISDGVAEVTGSTSGGIIGGITAAIVAIGAAAGAGAITGSEIGTLGAPETLGASVAAGGIIGGIFGGISGVVNQFTGHEKVSNNTPLFGVAGGLFSQATRAKTHEYEYDGQTFEYTDEDDFHRKIMTLKRAKAEREAERLKTLAEDRERQRLYARGKEQEYLKKISRETPGVNQETEIEDKLIEYDKQQAAALVAYNSMENQYKRANDRASAYQAYSQLHPPTDPDALVTFSSVADTLKRQNDRAKSLEAQDQSISSTNPNALVTHQEAA